MLVHCLVNQKGGCGKTTAAVNLAAALAARGERTLLVDLDPQGHATLALGIDGDAGPGIGEVLLDEVAPGEAVVTGPEGLGVLPAGSGLVRFEDQSERLLGPERALRRALSQLVPRFDRAIVDCPARADGVLTANALGAATTAVLVVETGAFALQGAVRALEVLHETAERQGSSFDLRVLATLFDRRTRFARELLIALQARFGDTLYENAIRSDVRLRECSASGVPIHVFAPRCRATRDFKDLAAEVLSEEPLVGRPLAAPSPSARGRGASTLSNS